MVSNTRIRPLTPAPVYVLREVTNRGDREPVTCGRGASLTIKFCSDGDAFTDASVVEDRTITGGGAACKVSQETEARLRPAGAHIKRGREEQMTSACALRVDGPCCFRPGFCSLSCSLGSPAVTDRSCPSLHRICYTTVQVLPPRFLPIPCVSSCPLLVIFTSVLGPASG